MTFSHRPTVLLAAALALVLSGCATTTPYQAASGGGQEGYSEQRLEDNRYRVIFTGSRATSQETVERYLMHRAAELTLAQGYDYFIQVQQDTEAEARRSGSSVGIGFGSGRFGSGFSIGLGTLLGPRGERYRAQADILLYRGQKPADEPRALDAREVITHLGPTLERPPVR